MKISLFNFGKSGNGRRILPAAGRARWLAGIGIATVTLGVALASTLWVRSTLAQRGGGDATGPSELGTEVPLKSVSGAVLNKFDAIDATDNPCTTSTAFVDMPGMTKTYSQGGTTGNSRSIVMFQGEWIPNTGRAELRLLVDGVVQSGPGDSASPFAATEGADDRTAGFNFITDAQTNGISHTAKIQWASVFGDSICVDERSLAILHR